jgi:hypothetical protein
MDIIKATPSLKFGPEVLIAQITQITGNFW